MRSTPRLFILVVVTILTLAACTSAPAAMEVPAVSARAAATATTTVTATQVMPPPTVTWTLAPTQTATPTSSFPPQVDCGEVFCQAEWQGLLARPIGPDGVRTIDPTYPYANTKNGTLDPHHGVEFPNGAGTPVLAAQAGEVVFAGADDLTVLGPYTGFYGNVVIVRHAELFAGRDLFTLYAHLSAIDVTVGEQLALGERVGAVGASGAATGSHLHFEVRLDENDYAHTTNPVLWFSPLNANGAGAGSTLAGSLVSRQGGPVALTTFELDRVAKDGAVLQNYYPVTYFPSGVNASPVLGENFAIPDLPPGDYWLNFIWGRYYTYEFSLAAGGLGFIKIQLD